MKTPNIIFCARINEQKRLFTPYSTESISFFISVVYNNFKYLYVTYKHYTTIPVYVSNIYEKNANLRIFTRVSSLAHKQTDGQKNRSLKDFSTIFRSVEKIIVFIQLQRSK